MLDNYDFYALLLQSSMPTLFAGILLMIFIIVDKTFENEVINEFIAAVLCAFGLGVVVTLDFIFDSLHILQKWQTVLASINVILKISAVIFLIRISQRKNTRLKKMLSVFILVNALICIMNMFTGIMFTISSNNEVVKGVLYYLPMIFVGIAIFLFSLSGIQNLHTNLGEGLVIFAIIISFLLANIFEAYYKTYFLVSQGAVVCVIFYFLCLNVELYKRDPLTELLNRRSFYSDLDKYKKRNLIVLSMDLNNLKKYNDTNGHDAGDLAIKTSAKCMSKTFGHIGIVYRTGGDEFMAIFINKSSEQLEKMIFNFREELSKTEYEVACGYAKYKPGDNIESVIKAADENMYVNKKTLKSPSRS